MGGKPLKHTAGLGHIAFIPDGNRRWAKRRHLRPIEGHAKGIDRMGDVLRWCRELGVKTVSFWAFSSENFNRDKEEVRGLFAEFENRLQRVLHDSELEKNQVRVRFIGDKSRFPQMIQQGMGRIERQTKKFGRYNLNLFIGYGGRAELVNAARKLAKQYGSNPAAIDEEAVLGALWSSEIPDPDLIIRTSGEQRLSGFLPFQSTYSELFFCPKLWPDISKSDIKKAIKEYERRTRRWGR